MQHSHSTVFSSAGTGSQSTWVYIASLPNFTQECAFSPHDPFVVIGSSTSMHQFFSAIHLHLHACLHLGKNYDLNCVQGWAAYFCCLPFTYHSTCCFCTYRKFHLMIYRSKPSLTHKAAKSRMLKKSSFNITCPFRNFYFMYFENPLLYLKKQVFSFIIVTYQF